MQPEMQQKVSDLIAWSVQAFSDHVAADAMNNARKAGEALCKAIILNHYGECLGEQIILGQMKYTGTPQRSPKELDFSGLITIVSNEDIPQYTIIRSKRIRHQIRSYLELIRTHGNPGSHDPNDPKDKVGPKHVIVTRTTLSNLLVWFFEDYISTETPQQLAAQISQFQSATDEPSHLPQGLESYKRLQENLRGWFEALAYKFTAHCIDIGDHFEWIIEEETRRGNVRILIYGLTIRINVQLVNTVQELVQYYDCDEGWIVTDSIVEKSARQETDKKRQKIIYCYYFDELLEETVDFSNYFEWLENEVKSRRIDEQYIPLACEYTDLDTRTNKLISKSLYAEEDGWIDGYADAWMQDHRKEHLSILGEFGTGKTWFALHYAWCLLQRYRDAKNRRLPRPRIPIFIPLRDFSKAIEVETLISDFFFRKHKIQIQGVFSAFSQLNKMGKLLLIFDGFDEMTDKVDKQKMIDNFWQLATIISRNSKVILTCRNEHFPQLKEGRQLLRAGLKQTTKYLTGAAPQFEIVQLSKFSSNQIGKLLSFHADKAIIEKIMSNDQLRDLLSRPIMTELIIDAIEDIENGMPVDMSRVYLYATKRKMERDIKQERTFTSLADKLYFLCEISWQMLSSDKLILNYKEFSNVVTTLFDHIEDKDLDYWRYDLRGQSMLVIDEEDGNYRPAHKSLLEFFVSFKFAAQLGILEDDFISVARSQSHIDFHQLPTPYTWEAYFRRVIDSNNDIIAIAPLDRFHASDLEILRNTIGKAPLTRAIMDLITGMIQLNDDTTQRKLLELIEECKGKQFDEIGYLAGNIVLLLLDFKHDFFKSKNLSSLCLRGFRFPTSVYTPEERRRSVAIPIQKFADVSGTQFQDSDLRDVNFGWSFENYGHFRNTNFTNTQLERFVFQTLQLDEIGLVESAGIVTLASPKELILLNRDTFTIEKRIYDENYVWHTSSLTDQNLLFQAMPRGFKVRDLKNLEVLYEQTVSPQRNPNASEPDSSWTACFAFAKDSNLLLVGCVNSFIHVFNLDNREEVQVLSSFTGVSKLSISPCERFFVSSGFHEFILWDFQNYQMLKFERYPERRSLKEYVAQFHPVESTFVLLDMNRVRIFDTSSMQFIHELQFGTDDNSSKLKYLAFSDDGALLFVGSSKEIYIIDYYKKSLVNIIRFSDNQFNFTLREDFRSSNIEDMVVDHTGQKIYLIHAMRCATEVSVDTGNITKIYWHLKDVSGANFTGATGLTEEIKDQLYKGGATI